MTHNCQLCGAIITSEESIRAGLGGQCQAAVYKAQQMVLYKETDFNLQKWIILAELNRTFYVETFANTKFRSQFKKDFYQSVKNGQRLSKKMLSIMQGHLDWKLERDQELDRKFELMLKQGEQQVAELRKQMLSEIKIDRALIEKARKLL